MFIEINGKTLNSTHIGEIRTDDNKLTITYIFLGGRKEEEIFEDSSSYESKKSDLGV